METERGHIDAGEKGLRVGLVPRVGGSGADDA